MQSYQREFLDYCVRLGVLRFGDFTLKSGRRSPYFFNAGLFDSGASLARLGRFYAQAILDAGIAFDMLFGPAYKGIPLATATSIALADSHGRDVPYAFNRKEAKDHGEGGVIVGAAFSGSILVVDDVISAGTSVRESADIIGAAGARLAGVVIALDRQEVGVRSVSAAAELGQLLGVAVASIVKLADLTEFLGERSDMNEELEAMRRYHETYGG